MSDLISRQDVIDAVHYYIESGYKCDIFQELKDLPSAEPEKRVKVELNDGWFHCCGCNYCTEHYSYDWKYCPMCGARLEWE